ncbi:hypothetical protein [Streptomyces caniscabiei]|uniref:Uncharacterized protein n=1 Tax=Streptomyces caniscabiei TaxID=2746961 RepID=A0A927L6A9_9ACTN|nr:hypothetical protein [Streptomyces caniscabiei]MBD9725616.1 hypothetical protein [Streptomyces caniscabiei]MDX3510121.1 hypothetical protein [Streptomyces caniscabiei]MDX3720884.1 hypothetical protein [Streptomyces caniscabiei]MDX3729047.1 hypothetical protein [Streptomyces caniscabiei]WEO27739.1 hypothetical protein IHE65_33845 [Streptomyces caniscabiei]
MATGGAPWPGAALGPALLIGVLVTGCAGATDPDGAASPSTTARGGGSPSPTPPEELCARLVSHWSLEVLDGDTYGDYQSMGLSNGQYDILRDVVDEARAEKRRAGATAARRLIERRARTGCEEWYRSGGPGEGPWS